MMALVIVVKNKVSGSVKNSANSIVEASNREYCESKQDGSSYEGRYIDSNNEIGYFGVLTSHETSTGEFKPLCEFGDGTVSLNYSRGVINGNKVEPVLNGAAPGGAGGGILGPGPSTTKTAQDYADDSDLVSGTIAKGNLITINSAEYRILSVDGTQIKVLAMEDVRGVVYNSSRFVTTSINGTKVQKYEGSDLDNVMTTFYNNMPEDLKQAVVAQNINQSMYQAQYTSSSITADAVIQYYNDFSASPADSKKRGLLRKGEVSVGERFVYALDIDDVIEYFDGGFNCQQLNNMFFKTTSSTDTYAWLRSANASGSTYAFLVYGYYGYMGGYDSSETYRARPAFVLDLSKLG